MRAVRRVLVILTSLGVLVAGSAVAQAAVPASARPAGAASDAAAPPCPITHRAQSTIPPPTPAYPQGYFHGDWRLGPGFLPSTPPLAPLLRNYRRTDNESSRQFIECYWNDQTHGWWFPDNNGFVLDNQGNPIETPATLTPGQRVDLFGTGAGRFLAPAGTPYNQRALPPSNLDTLTNAFPFGYHLYEVEKPVSVQAGAIRPWFGQPGLGLQYFLGNVTIPDLVANGSLKTLN
jgi:hypothetical protein